MKIGIITLLTLFVSSLAAYFLIADSGHVGIEYRGYQIAMSFHTLIIMTTLLFLCIWLISKIIIAPRRIGEVAGRYRAARAGQKMTRGMIEVAEGNFTRGERILAKAASTSDSPLFNYLQAARAAHLQGRNQRRDDWLKLAYQEVPEAANAVLLTQAEFQLDHGHYEQALAALRRLDENSKNHGHALALMGRLYFKLEDWASLKEILPRITKYSQIKPKKLANWKSKIQCEELSNAENGSDILKIWKRISLSQKSNIETLMAYYQGLMRNGLHEKAEKEIANSIETNWQPALIKLYGDVHGVDINRQITNAETWFKNHSDDLDLLLTMAKLCLKNELWGKARYYLELLIESNPNSSAFEVYGDLLNKMGETEAAKEAYKNGLQIKNKNKNF
ncbi:MAG: hypothetical protein CMQ54_02140 [Gammaproteobacteria bacterium]|nr:hypothetical protein [Gammaproteobacteria bacterium]|tara:strand:- start:1251 stop:2423 length:1173 start_codon:yes stop_codon:yes gene_type:complete